MTLDAIEPLLAFGLRTRFEDLPAAVVERTRVAILDTLAASLAGFRGEAVAELAGLVGDWGGKPESTVLATGRKVPAPLAALANATTARAVDLDDVHEQNTCHVNVTTVPVALALAEARAPVAGRDLVAAIAVGSELICRISSAPKLSFSETGHSLTYGCGYFGAALTAARLLGLSHEAARNALGIAYARIAGNQQGFVAGAMTVKLMQGIAAEGGLVSALMAERGLTGSSEILEGKFGYFPVYQRGQYDRDILTCDLGSRWLIADVSIKPVYPCCKFTHGPIDAVLETMAAEGLSADDIATMRFRITNKEVYDLVCAPRERKWNPQSVTDVQFSLPCVAAIAAVHRGIGFRTLSAETLSDERVRDVMRRVDVDLDVEAQGEGRGRFPMPGILTLTDRRGRRFERTVVHVRGHPRNPMDFEAVAAKLDECARYGHPRWRGAARLLEALRALESAADAGAIARICAREDVREAEAGVPPESAPVRAPR